MTAVEQLPPSAQADVGLIGFAFLVTVLLATLAALVYVAIVERRRDRERDARLTPAQVEKSIEIDQARRRKVAS